MSDFIYLASQSPRRQDLLRQIHVDFELLVAHPSEDTETLEALLANELPHDYVQRVCLAKADAAWQRMQQRALPVAPVLTADTTVALGDKILNKPANVAAAIAMLSQLSGTTHQVLTAVCVQTTHEQRTLLSTSSVQFRPLTHAEITAYVATGEPFGKAGSYALQGRAAIFAQMVSGSFSGIIGLPLFETAQLLQALGIQVM